MVWRPGDLRLIPDTPGAGPGRRWIACPDRRACWSVGTVLPFDDEDLPFFTVGQVAQMLEVQHAFLRRLDEFGVVCPSRSAGGQRRYSRTEVTVIRYVSRLANEGMTLAAIRRVLELESQVRALEAERDQLRDALAARDRLLARLARGATTSG